MKISSLIFTMPAAVGAAGDRSPLLRSIGGIAVLAAAPLLTVELVDRSNQSAENGIAIHGPRPFQDMPQDLKGIFFLQLGPANPFLSHKGS